MDLLSKPQQETINKAKEYIIDIFKDDSSGHDIEHSMRVFKNAIDISKNILSTNKEIKLNIFIIAISAILHDVDDYKLNNFNKDNPNQNLLNFVEQNNIFSSQDIDLIKGIISEVSYKAGETETPKTLEAKIVQDADRLDAIGAIGIARAFAFGGAKKRKMYKVENINNLIKRNFEPFDMDDISFEKYKRKKSDTITHFYEKLLKLENMMNTDQAKLIAHKRTNFMKIYLEELFEEIIDK